MKTTTWFGYLDDKSGEVALAGGEGEMAERLMEISEAADSGFGRLEGVPAEGEGWKTFQPDLRALALANGLFRDDEEYNATLRETALGLVIKKLRASAGAEAELLQTIEALDDLNEVVNRLEERLYEWSRLHDDRSLRGRALAEFLAEEEESIGVLARSVIELHDAKRSVQKSLETATVQIAPNLSNLAGPLLAARIISRAGGLKRLSEMPASAIQVMGAEKALFKHLRGKAPSPKHGMIYRHPAIMGTTRGLRGRAARALAAKLAIGSRIDRYSGEVNADLKPALDRRIEEIRNSSPSSPSSPGKKRKGKRSKRRNAAP